MRPTPRRRLSLPRSISSQSAPSMAVEQDVEDDVLEEPHLVVRRPGAVHEALVQRAGEGYGACPDLLDVRVLDLAPGTPRPHRFRGDELAAQYGSFVRDAFGQEGVAIGERGDRGRSGALEWREEPHVHRMDMAGHPASLWPWIAALAIGFATQDVVARQRRGAADVVVLPIACPDALEAPRHDAPPKRSGSWSLGSCCVSTPSSRSIWGSSSDSASPRDFVLLAVRLLAAAWLTRATPPGSGWL